MAPPTQTQVDLERVLHRLAENYNSKFPFGVEVASNVHAYGENFQLNFDGHQKVLSYKDGICSATFVNYHKGVRLNYTVDDPYITTQGAFLDHSAQRLARLVSSLIAHKRSRPMAISAHIFAEQADQEVYEFIKVHMRVD